MLVEGACKEGIHQLAIIQGLPNDAPNKLEEVQVVGSSRLIVLYNRVGIGLEGGSVLWHLDKQAEVGIEDLSGHDLQEINSSVSACNTHHCYSNVLTAHQMQVIPRSYQQESACQTDS